MGGDFGAAEVVPGALDHARSHPDDTVILVGDETVIRSLAGDASRRTCRSWLPARSSAWTSTRHWPFARRRTPRSSSRWTSSSAVRPTPSSRPATRAPAWPRRCCGSAGCPAWTDPPLAVQMITDSGPLVLLDIGANPDSTAENLAQYARMGAIFSERVLGVARPRVALLSIGEEKGKGDARIQRATELLDATDLRFEGNVEGKDLTRHLADVVVCDAVLGQRRRSSSSRASRRSSSTCGATSSPGRCAASSRPCSCARASPGSAASSTTSGSVDRRCSGVRGTVIITHGRARRRMVGFACEVAATMARTGVPALIAEALAAVARRRAAAPAADGRDGRTRRRRGGDRREPTRADRPAGRHRRARPRSPRSRSRASRGSAAADRPGAAARRPARVRSAIREDRVVVRLWIVARPGQPLVPLTAQVRTRGRRDRRTAARPRCSGPSPSWSMASGG